MREYNVIARITAYVNNQAVKSKVVTNPLVYTTNDRIVTAKSFVHRNETLFNFYAVHDSAKYSKELDVLRSLTNMAYIKPCKARHNAKYRAHLALIGLEDFESFLDQEMDIPCLYLDIAIHATEGEKKRQKVLTHISFRVLSTDPTTAVKIKALTDWFRLEPKEQNEKLVSTNKPTFDIDENHIENNNSTSSKISDIKDKSKECIYRQVAGAFYAISSHAKDWAKEDYRPNIKDVVVLSRCVDAIHNFTGSIASREQFTELEGRVINISTLFNEFLYVIEHKDVLDKDLIKLLGQVCETINTKQISEKLHAVASKLSKQQ